VATYKERMSLLGKYKKLHVQRYNEAPTHNLNAEQWAADGLVESYGLEGCYDLLEYYFETSQSPSWKFFSFNADKLLELSREERKQVITEIRETGGNLFLPMNAEDGGMDAAQGRLILLNGKVPISDIFVWYVTEFRIPLSNNEVEGHVKKIQEVYEWPVVHKWEYDTTTNTLKILYHDTQTS